MEGHNFDTRKHLVEYDDIINKHRQVVYNLRQNFLTLFTDQEIAEDAEYKTSQDFVLSQLKKEIEDVISFHTLAKENVGDFDPKEIIETIKSIFTLSNTEKTKLEELLAQTNKDNSHEKRTEVINYLNDLVQEKYMTQTEHIN